MGAIDENDRLREGSLPDDPEADARPMEPAPDLIRGSSNGTGAKHVPDHDPGVGIVDLDREAPVVGSFLDEAARRMMARSLGEEKPIPLPIDALAEALNGGLWPGLHIIVGNTGSGKSQFALQIGLHAARSGIPVLYIGLELGKVDLVARLLGLLEAEARGGQGCKWSDLFLGRSPDLERIIAEHGPTLRELPFHLTLVPPHGWNYTALLSLAYSMHQRYSPGGEQRPMLVVLDFLQLVTGEERDLRERIGRAAYLGRSVARELGATVLLLSSTARENYKILDSVNGDPSGKDASILAGMGKESGEIEFAADSVLVLVREPWRDGRPPKEGTHVWLAVAKQRVGPPTWVELRFNGSYFFKPAPGPMVTL